MRQGEPGFETDTGKLKIGDGLTPWNALPYIESVNSVINIRQNQKFPQKGDPDVIYKKEDTKELYQFNTFTGRYEKLISDNFSNIASTGDIADLQQNSDVEIILDCGGWKGEK